MSSILKALRKLEHEKSAMGEGSVDLARDILKRSYEERRSSWAGPALAVVMIALLLVVLGWWVFVPQTALQSDNGPMPQASETVIPVPPDTSKAPPQQSSPVIMPNRGTLQREEELPEAQQQQSPMTVPDPPVPLKQATAELLVIPDLTIDEIIFVADPSARLAVINELPVMQGTDIAGARVIEILADRVRFDFKGVRFEKFQTPGR